MTRSMLEVMVKQCSNLLAKAENAETEVDRYVYFTALSEVLSDASSAARQSASFAKEQVQAEVMRNSTNGD